MNFFKPEEIAAELYKAIESEGRYRPFGVATEMNVHATVSAPPSYLAVVFNKLLERHFHEKMRGMNPRAIYSLMDLIFSKEAFVKAEVTEQTDGSRRTTFAFIDPPRFMAERDRPARAFRDEFFDPSEMGSTYRKSHEPPPGWEPPVIEKIPEKTPEELVDEMMAGLGDVK